ncbi:MAG: cation:H+ antiporter [Candidatus Pseudothioglobus sp.]|jgi:cation:H+ antiporter
MPETLDFLKLFGGFVYLLMGGDLLVRGALGLARESKIPPMVVGLTVVAMGTSAPELMVSSVSALTGFPGIAVGNIIGSNIANVLLVIGVPVLIHPIVCDQAGLGKQTGLMVAVCVLFIVLCVFQPVTFWEGVLLVSLLGGFLLLATRGSDLVPSLDDAEEELERVLGLPGKSITIVVFIILGIIALPLGADLVVEGAAGLAANWGVSEAVIGLSLIALGTSLPELSTTVIAAFHKSSDVAIGNVVGSNVFNILAIFGITALLTDIPVDPAFLTLDVWIMLGSSVLLLLFVLFKATIGKAWGVALLAAYLGYMVSIY